MNAGHSLHMRPALHIRKLSSDQQIEVRDHEHCLKEEPAMFASPREEQGFRKNNPSLWPSLSLPLELVLMIGLPSLIAILVKRRKKKQA